MRLMRLFSIQLAILVSAACVFVATAGAGSVLAAVPVLSVNTVRHPVDLPPGGEGTIDLEVVDLGGAPALGGTTPIVIADKLPAGLKATAISGPGCELATLRCEYQGRLLPYSRVYDLEVSISVKVAASTPASVTNVVSVGGGGALTALTREALPVGATQPGFGIESFQFAATNEDGSLDTQAGSHPFQLTSTVNFDTDNMKNLRLELPPGLVGDPEAVPQCTAKQFETLLPPRLLMNVRPIPLSGWRARS